MNGDTRRWVLTVLGLAALAVSVATVPATAQSGGPVGYHGDAETEDGTPIPNGTTLVAVASGSVQDRIDVSPSGQYGTVDPTGPKLFVDTDETVSFYVEKADGTRIDALTTADPTQAEGAKELDITFPAGTVASAPYFTVSELQPADGTAIEGETIEVSATVSNSVDSGTQSVSFAVDGQTRASKDVTLDTSESETVTFSLDTATVGTGSHTYTIASDNESKSETLTVAESRVDFTVSGLSPVETAVVTGETVDVTATVTNEGNVEGTQTVTTELDGSTVDSTEVTLGPGNDTEVSFTLATAERGAGDYTHRIATANDSESGTLTVDPRRANLTVSALDPRDTTVVTGETVTVSATVTNEGNAEGTQTVTQSVDGSEVDSEAVTLEPGTNTEVTFTGVNTTQLGPGTYQHTVASANDSESGTLTVEDREPATFTVSALSPASRAVTQGTTVEVTATITNVGEREGTQQVRLDVGDSEVDSRSLSLASAESESVTLTVDTSSLAPGAYTHRIATVNDAENGTLTVERAGSPRFTVSALTPATTAVQQGTAVDVTATVTNEGQTTGSQQVRLVLDGTETDSESVSLAPGGNTVVEFDAVDTGSLAVGSHTHTVETANDSRSGTIAVSDDTGGTETTREPGGETTRPPDGTAEPTEVPGNGTQQAPTTAGNDSSGDGGGGSGDDELVPWGLLQTILLYVGLPLAVVYGVLKALAIYLGY